MTVPARGVLRAAWLDRVAYLPAQRLQSVLAAERLRGEGSDTLLLLEHPPTYTLGRAAPASQLLWSPGECARRGIEIVRADRGGGATYHGPGQLVGYAIVDLRGRGLGVRAFVAALEQAMIDLLALLGVRGERVPGRPGVWVGGAKVAAIGLRCRRGVSTHGFALNVAPDLASYAGIVPCGLPDAAVTSLRELVRRPPTVAELVPLAAACVASALAYERVTWVPPAVLPFRSGAGCGGRTPGSPAAPPGGA